MLGAEAERAAALLDGLGRRTIVVAEDWAEGMGASLRAGLRSLADSADDGVVVSLVDLPDLVPAVVARVVAAGAGPAALARASYDGRPGTRSSSAATTGPASSRPPSATRAPAPTSPPTTSPSSSAATSPPATTSTPADSP